MKQILLLICTAMIFITFSSCDDNEEELNSDSIEITVPDNDSEAETDESYHPDISEAGLSHLDLLVHSKSGWRNIKEIDDKYSIMIFSEDSKHNYSLDWSDDQYSVTSDGEWITLYDPEELKSEEFIMGECYAINFLSKDTFEICYVHMCARIKDEYWDKYARVKDDDIIALNRSDDPEDINNILNKIKGKYIEVEYNNTGFRQKCTYFNIYKYKAEENEAHYNFWFDHVMDGYEYHIENVSYDPMIPDKYIFRGTENYFEEIKSKLTFMMFNDYRVLTVESNNEKLWYIHEDEYDNIAEPAEPCNEDEY